MALLGHCSGVHFNSIKCLICAVVIETANRIAVFGISQHDLHDTVDFQDSQMVTGSEDVK